MRAVTEPSESLDAPSSARHFTTKAWHVAIWVPTGGFHPGVRSAVVGPGGLGSAWLSAEPNALGMQIGGVRATVGDEEVLLRRNGFRLRRTSRVIRIVGTTRRWAMTFPTGRSSQITDEVVDRVLWRRDGALREGHSTLSADDVAILVLLDHVSLESTVAGPLRLLRSL